MEEQGCAYKVTCSITNKSYIGQASLYKYKDGKAYNYGANGRWNDHVSSAKLGATTHIAEAIRIYGPEAFTVKVLSEAALTELDGLEAVYISFYKTLYPLGYNTAKHSRVKNRESTNLAAFYIPATTAVEVKPIKANGEKALVYVYLTVTTQTDRIRLTFGQGLSSTYEDAYEEAIAFAYRFETMGIPVKYSAELDSDDPLDRYRDKLDDLRKESISRIRLASMKSGDKTLAAVYVSLTDSPGWKNQRRICFGGATVTFNEAYSLAKLFISQLLIDRSIEFIDAIESTDKVSNRQPLVRLVVLPNEENGVNPPSQEHITA